MVQITAVTLFALALARIVRAPRGAWRYILGVAVAAALATQFLPAGHPLRADVAESSQNLAWLAVAMIPVAAYGLWVRRLRLRTGVDRTEKQEQTAEHPRGLVQIRDDAVLVAETRAALDDMARSAGMGPDALSLGWRGENGALEGHLRLRLIGARAEVEMLHVAPEARGGGIGTALLTAAEGEAKTRGVRAIAASVGSWQAVPFFTANGYRPVIDRETGSGQALHMLEKALT